MPYCIKCRPFSCGSSAGIIAVEWSTRSNISSITSDCDTSSSSSMSSIEVPLVQTPIPPSGPVDSINSYSPSINGGGKVKTVSVPGPVTGSISITAYAFSAGKGRDIWNEIRCTGQAQASQSLQYKYDLITNKHYIIPTKDHSAQLTGNTPSTISISNVCTTTTLNSSIVNGITLTTEMGTYLGSNLRYTGEPLPVSFPDQSAYTVFSQKNCFLSSFSYNVDFPTSPAIVNYVFQYILSCEDSAAGGPKM